LTDRGAVAPELDYHSSSLPGGTLFAAIYDRVFMQLSDRGGASNVIGDRWASLCADALQDASPQTQSLLQARTGVTASTTVRLDHIPAIARIASRHKLQNPDFLMIGNDRGRQVLWAADAKFSVDTARSRQVSDEVVAALLELGTMVRGLLPSLDGSLSIENGVFVCPDYALTHRLLAERRGPRRATVSQDEVRLMPVCPDAFLAPLGFHGLQEFLAGLDALPFERESSLVVSLYYFRLSRAALCCWQDQTAPLLFYRDAPVVDQAAVESEARRLATIRTSAWGLILRWNDLAEEIRQQRHAVDQVTALPIRSKQLRNQIEDAAAAAGVEPPSSSRARKAVGSWYRSRIREEFGPIPPPVASFGQLLDDLARFCRSVQPEVATVTERVIEDLVTAPQPAAEEPSGLA